MQFGGDKDKVIGLLSADILIIRHTHKRQAYQTSSWLQIRLKNLHANAQEMFYKTNDSDWIKVVFTAALLQFAQSRVWLHKHNIGCHLQVHVT